MALPLPSLGLTDVSTAAGGEAGPITSKMGSLTGSAGNQGLIFNQAGQGSRLDANQAASQSSTPEWLWYVVAGAVALVALIFVLKFKRP